MQHNTPITNKLAIRFASPQDVPVILSFIKGLADYEKMSDQVVATEAILHESLFIKKQAEVIIAYYNNEAVGFALFFHNFSTFLGKANLYLEDLYVNPSHRGQGIGKSLLAYLGKIAVERDCARLDWWCLDWNQPAIDFYKEMGAVPMDEWTTFRVQGDALKKLASLA